MILSVFFILYITVFLISLCLMLEILGIFLGTSCTLSEFTVLVPFILWTQIMPYIFFYFFLIWV